MAGKPTPLRVALLTFGAVLLGGLLGFLLVTSASGGLHDQPFAQGQQFGRGIGTFAVVGATLAYVIQKRRITS
jgi:hypothetical protein